MHSSTKEKHRTTQLHQLNNPFPDMQGNMDMHLIWNITLSKVYIHDIVITTKITKYIIRRKKLSKFVTNEHKQTLNLCVFDFQLVPQKSTWLNIHVNSYFYPYSSYFNLFYTLQANNHSQDIHPAHRAFLG